MARLSPSHRLDGHHRLFSHHRIETTLRRRPFVLASESETLDIFEFIARLLTQIPEPRVHGMHNFGAYSSRARAFRKKRQLTLQSLGNDDNSSSRNQTELSPKKRAALTKSWAQWIRRVYLSDPLKCECGGTLRVIAFITELKAVRKILDPLNSQKSPRAPPQT